MSPFIRSFVLSLSFVLAGCVPTAALVQAAAQRDVNAGHAADDDLPVEALAVAADAEDAWAAQLYLLDGSSYIYRAYYGFRDIATSGGMPTNAVFGFTKMLLDLIPVLKQFLNVDFQVFQVKRLAYIRISAMHLTLYMVFHVFQCCQKDKGNMTEFNIRFYTLAEIVSWLILPRAYRTGYARPAAKAPNQCDGYDSRRPLPSEYFRPVESHKQGLQRAHLVHHQ